MRVLIIFALVMLIGCQTSSQSSNDTYAPTSMSGDLEFVSGRYNPTVLYSDGDCKIMTVHHIELGTNTGRAPWSHPDTQGIIRFEIVGGKSVNIGMSGKYIGAVKSRVKNENPYMIVDMNISHVNGMCTLVFAVAGAFNN